jgi:hypothetical protein
MWKAERIGKDGDCYHLLNSSHGGETRSSPQENEPSKGNPEDGSIDALAALF